MFEEKEKTKRNCHLWCYMRNGSCQNQVILVSVRNAYFPLNTHNIRNWLQSLNGICCAASATSICAFAANYTISWFSYKWLNSCAFKWEDCLNMYYTRIWVFSCMGKRMAFKRRSTYEFLRANSTSIWVVSCMNLFELS